MATERGAERESARRRLMFVAGEDFYFLAYTTLLLLHELQCLHADAAFVDSRKVAYLADLLGSDSDLVLALTQSPLSPSGRNRLSLLFDRAAARHAPLERIQNALARRRLVSFTREHGQPDRMFLAENDDALAFLRSGLFDGERERLRKLKSSLRHLRTMTLATMKERLFGRHGVQTWGD